MTRTPHWRVDLGDALALLEQQPSNSVDSIVTSSPYFGLRDYKVPPSVIGGTKDCRHVWEIGALARMAPHAGLGALSDQYAPRLNPRPKHSHRYQNPAAGMRTKQGSLCMKCGAYFGALGLEPTPERFVVNLMLIFREAWRVLKPHGTLFLNIGDSWANDAKGPRSTERSTLEGRTDLGTPRKSWRGSALNIKRKDLIGIPEMTAIALRMDGWYWRDRVIWRKPNGMPSSVKDRTTANHEHVLLFSKSPRYYYDRWAIAEPISPETIEQLMKAYVGVGRKNYRGAGVQNPSDTKRRVLESLLKRGLIRVTKSGNTARKLSHAFRPGRAGANMGRSIPWSGLTRNARSVWTIDPDISEIEQNAASVWDIRPEPSKVEHFAVMPSELARRMVLSTCPIGGTVLDPFTGSGTTGMVAIEHGRHFIGFELNKKFAGIACDRIASVIPGSALEEFSA